MRQNVNGTSKILKILSKYRMLLLPIINLAWMMSDRCMFPFIQYLRTDLTFY